MPSQTFIVRAHARTIYTRPITFVCAKCGQMTTRDCYPGKLPKYCLSCSPRKHRKTDFNKREERGMFQPTHYLVATNNGKLTEVALEPSPDPGWFWVRTALDWFSGESIIQYHKQQGLRSQGVSLVGYLLEPLKQ